MWHRVGRNVGKGGLRTIVVEGEGAALWAVDG